MWRMLQKALSLRLYFCHCAAPTALPRHAATVYKPRKRDRTLGLQKGRGDEGPTQRSMPRMCLGSIFDAREATTLWLQRRRGLSGEALDASTYMQTQPQVPDSRDHSGYYVLTTSTNMDQYLTNN